jgi:branched-chain amino acid transport system ATP-binding protein
MLTIQNLEVVYNDVIWVLKGVSMEIPEGGMICLLGSNGAGKSTTLKAISGVLKLEWGKITGGYIEFEGDRINNWKPQDIAQAGIIQCFEGRRLFKHLTTEENLRMGGYLLASNAEMKRRLEMVYHYFPRLTKLKDRICGYMSGGEQQMMVIGRALMSRPKIMLLDEPSLGLSPLLVKEIFKIIQRINQEEKVAILLVEQNTKAALSITDYGFVMENGRTVLDGATDKLKDNEDVREFYLGLSQIGQRKSFKDTKFYKRRKRWLA